VTDELTSSEAASAFVFRDCFGPPLFEGKPARLPDGAIVEEWLETARRAVPDFQSHEAERALGQQIAWVQVAPAGKEWMREVSKLMQQSARVPALVKQHPQAQSNVPGDRTKPAIKCLTGKRKQSQLLAELFF
jgi:hypothetical protein